MVTMHLNKPAYTLRNNTRYALKGLGEIIRNESSFRLQLLLFVAASVVVWTLDLSRVQQAVLFVSLFLPIVSEIINSAIERCVDLYTTEHHELAGRAKDAGAALVFVSFVIVAIVWALVFYCAYAE